MLLLIQDTFRRAGNYRGGENAPERRRRPDCSRSESSPAVARGAQFAGCYHGRVTPHLVDRYDRIVIDVSGNTLTDNTVVAAPNAIFPLIRNRSGEVDAIVDSVERAIGAGIEH